jgi:hypothetical protein
MARRATENYVISPLGRKSIRALSAEVETGSAKERQIKKMEPGLIQTDREML